jgi:hypothetical protein
VCSFRHRGQSKQLTESGQELVQREEVAHQEDGKFPDISACLTYALGA